MSGEVDVPKEIQSEVGKKEVNEGHHSIQEENVSQGEKNAVKNGPSGAEKAMKWIEVGEFLVNTAEKQEKQLGILDMVQCTSCDSQGTVRITEVDEKKNVAVSHLLPKQGKRLRRGQGKIYPWHRRLLVVYIRSKKR